LPPIEVLDKQLATEIGCKLATACDSNGAHLNGCPELNGSVVKSVAGITNGSANIAAAEQLVT
jgi:hypothetical protein